MNDFDPDWKWGHVTRDGRKARIICKDRRGARHPIIALIELSGAESYETYAANGTCGVVALDLLNAPAPKRRLEAWVNFYPNGYTSSFLMREVADACANENRIACVRVTCEEGDGL